VQVTGLEKASSLRRQALKVLVDATRETSEEKMYHAIEDSSEEAG
jgi:hypothetical protein